MNPFSFKPSVAFGRHVLSFVMGAITFAASVKLIPQDQANLLMTSISQIAHALGEITVAAAPIIALISGLIAARSATQKAQLQSVAENPLVEKVVVKDPMVAAAIPSPKVDTK